MKKKRSFKLTLPLSVIYNTTKAGKEYKFLINLNDYRAKGTKFFILNKAKQVFHELVGKQIEELPTLTPPIRCNYTVFRKDRRDYDVNNVCSIADKFFMDALVERGKIPDDNQRYYLGFGETNHGGVDKENPRIEVEIKEI